MITEPMEQEYDIADQARQKLMSVVPEAFADGKILWEKLRESLGDMLDDDDETAFEHYGLNWPGKRKAKKIAATPSTLTLIPLKGEGIDEDTTENIFIEGDNLEVLKILYKSYKEKIKMIYIDPPYNTGNDFVYNDDFCMTEEEFMRAEGSIDEQGNRLVSNKKTSGRFHANWLNMMYPRLKIARELLKQNGLIFISIDNNEIANLRLLCDEVFGEENFIEQLIWRKKSGGGQQDDFFVTEHDYIICYAKYKDKLKLNEKKTQAKKTGYGFLDEITQKYYKKVKLAKWGSAALRQDRPTMYDYPELINPDNKQCFPKAPDGREGRWRFGRESVKNMLNENKICWEKSSDGEWIPYEKEYEPSDEDFDVLKERSILFDLAENTEGSNELSNLFGIKDVFTNPKPVGLLAHLVLLGSSIGEQDIILDFFAGSGSLAHSVMLANMIDNGDRKFIVVQLNEEVLPTKKESLTAYGFLSEIEKPYFISEITKERIRRSSSKIQLEKHENANTDLGFKCFKTVRSNHKKWGKYSITTSQEADGLFAAHQHSLIDDWEYNNVMTEIILTEGFALTSKIQTFDSVTTNEIVRISDSDKEYVLYVCLDEQINPNTIKALNMNDNDIFICLGSAIDDQNLSALHDKGRIRTL